VIAPSLKEAFALARMKDPTLNRMLQSDRALEEIIIELLNEKTKLVAQVMALETIAPRRIKLPDGSVRVWRCPDEFVPLIPGQPNPPRPRFSAPL
jgi:hypothetical protein